MVNKERLCGVLFCAYWEKEGKAFYKEKEKKLECARNRMQGRKKRKKAKLSKEKNKSGKVYIIYVEVA